SPRPWICPSSESGPGIGTAGPTPPTSTSASTTSTRRSASCSACWAHSPDSDPALQARGGSVLAAGPVAYRVRAAALRPRPGVGRLESGSIVLAAAGVYLALSLGANDGANALAAAVGARVRSTSEATWLIALFGLLGALTLGGGVSRTLGEGIVRLDLLAQ